MNPKQLEADSKTIGIGFVIDHALLAIITLARHEELREIYLDGLDKLSGVLEILFVKGPSRVFMENPDYLSICVYPWCVEARKWLVKEAAAKKQDVASFVSHLCGVADDLCQSGISSVSDEDFAELERVLEKLSYLTLLRDQQPLLLMAVIDQAAARLS